MGFRIREVSIPILPPNSSSLRVLHFSDIHLAPYQKGSLNFIRTWRDLNPDLVISTGDHIASARSIPLLSDALGPLLEKPGFYVFGSNDYFGPKFKNPLRYLLPDRGKRIHGNPLPWKDLDSSLGQSGWINLTHKIIQTKVNGVSIELRGTDDAHLQLDDYKRVKQIRGRVDLSVGVTHAPYARVLSEMSSDQLDLVFSGHTHGGQIRLPWFGGTRSLATNCDLPNWRSRGVTKLPREPWLHVSAGMGHNPLTPFRFLSPREASIINLESHS
jgi:predicted MPP superfamily phosphohydrolase